MGNQTVDFLLDFRLLVPVGCYPEGLVVFHPVEQKVEHLEDCLVDL